MRNKDQIQDIDLPGLREAEKDLTRTPSWWKILIVSFVSLVFLGTIFLTIFSKRYQGNLLGNTLEDLTPTPVAEKETDVTQPILSGFDKIKNDLSKTKEFLNAIDPQQELLQPPLVDLKLGL